MLKGKTCSKGWERFLKESGWGDNGGENRWTKVRLFHRGTVFSKGPALYSVCKGVVFSREFMERVKYKFERLALV